ncbi:YihY/virulence factor BrkB family protein [Microbacterium sp. 22242]|uniref:YihY/virulence factor BrkB family protein n=1 Tax=Microbacterium sp. 22242 TaxID=3453896 RepID=UPI003F852DA5
MVDSGAELRERLEAPIERAAEITRRTMQVFPIRVWRRFLRRNGFLLSAGLAYQGLFAVFALLYIAFASAGLWLGGSERAIRFVTAVANSYVPGIVGEHGLVHPDDVQEIAASSTGVLSVTGIIAAMVVVWTASTAITFARRAVRDMFGLAYDARSVVLLKIRDVLAALAFGLALLLGSVLGFTGVWTLRQMSALLGWSLSTPAFEVITRLGSMVVMFAIDTTALALLVGFLTGTRLHWRTIRPGALLGGAAVVILQLGAGLLLAHTPTNPLLATFAVIVAMLLWCRSVALVVLVAACWIALTAEDRDQPLADEDAVRGAELESLELAARVRLRRATDAYARAPWWRRRAASRERQRARQEWEAAADELETHRILIRRGSRTRRAVAPSRARPRRSP